MSFYFYLTGLFLLLPYLIITEQINEILVANYTFYVYFGTASVLGLLLTILILLVVSIAGSIFVNISGIFKDFFLTYAGFIFFNDIRPTESVLIGLTLSFLGTSYYIVDKVRE